MKKTVTIILLIMLALILISKTTNAMTKAELKEYLFSKHEISGHQMELTSVEKKQVEDFYAKYDITDEQADFIKQKVEECKAIMTKAGVTQVQQLSKADKHTLLVKGQEAALKMGLAVDMSTGVITDATTGEVIFVMPKGKLTQTGSDNFEYLFPAGIAIIAVASLLVYKKVRA